MMKSYQIYTAETASSPVDKLLLAVEDMLGFVPNVFGAIAASEPALRAFIQLNVQLAEAGFSDTERAIIQIAVSTENECTYCVAGHTAFAEQQDVDANIVNAARNKHSINNKKLNVLQKFTRALVQSKGPIDAQHLKEFLSVGYTQSQALEVIMGVCVKTFSNLTNNLIGLPLDEAFAKHAWSPTQLKAVNV